MIICKPLEYGDEASGAGEGVISSLSLHTLYVSGHFRHKFHFQL